MAPQSASDLPTQTIAAYPRRVRRGVSPACSLAEEYPSIASRAGFASSSWPRRVTAADTVRSVGHERPEILFGSPQALLHCTQGGIEPADQKRQHNEQRQPHHGRPVLRGSVFSGKRKVCAYGECERGGDQTRLPAAVPGAHHHSDGEYRQTAFRDVGKQQRRNQRQRSAEDRDSVAQYGRASGLNAK